MGVRTCRFSPPTPLPPKGGEIKDAILSRRSLSAKADHPRLKRRGILACVGKKLQVQGPQARHTNGGQVLRREAYLWYVAVTKDAVQRRSWTFYEAVRVYPMEDRPFRQLLDRLELQPCSKAVRRGSILNGS